MLPAALGLIVLAGPIVQLLASYGAVQGGQTELLADTLAAFAVGLPFFSAFQLQTRTFYATGDSRTPALVNIVAAVVDLAVAISLAFALDLGVAGLAFGHAASYLAGTVVLTVLLRRRLGSVDGRHVRSTALRASGAAVVSAAAAWATAWAIAELLPVDRLSGRLVQVAAAILTGVLAFAGASFMLRVEEVDEVRKALTTRFRR
jgi:putative peptidoglycan lipid II flippase